MVVIPISCFTNKGAPLHIIRSRDVRFHGVSFPIKEFRVKHQHQLYNESHPPVSEEQYRQMLFSEELPPAGQAEPFDPHAGREIVINDHDEDVEITEDDIKDVPRAPGEEEADDIDDPLPVEEVEGANSSSSSSGDPSGGIQASPETPPVAPNPVTPPPAAPDQAVKTMIKSYDFFLKALPLGSKSLPAHQLTHQLPSLPAALTPKSELSHKSVTSSLFGWT